MLTLGASMWGGPACAQALLTVTDDGSRAFFSVSGLRPKSLDQILTGTQGYSFSASGLQLLPTSFPDPEVSLTSIASDGNASVIAANGVRPCPAGGPFTSPPCPLGFERYQTVIRLPSDERPLEVLFAGLAPTLIGQYQIDLRLPTTTTGPPAVGLACRSAGHSLQVAAIPTALVTEGAPTAANTELRRKSGQ